MLASAPERSLEGRAIRTRPDKVRPMLPTLLSLALVAPQMVAGDNAPPTAGPIVDLRQEDVERWRDHIRPAAEDLAFEAIQWIPSFAEGLREADRQERPLLFWAMNGHPLGCT